MPSMFDLGNTAGTAAPGDEPRITKFSDPGKTISSLAALTSMLNAGAYTVPANATVGDVWLFSGATTTANSSGSTSVPTFIISINGDATSGLVTFPTQASSANVRAYSFDGGIRFTSATAAIAWITILSTANFAGGIAPPVVANSFLGNWTGTAISSGATWTIDVKGNMSVNNAATSWTLVNFSLAKLPNI